MLPVLLDMVDDIYASLDAQAKSSDGIPLLFVPQMAQGGCRQQQRCRRGPFGCHRSAGPWGRRCQRGECAAAPAKADFELAIDVASFKPEEVAVKVKGHEVIIEGTHEERQDEYGFISRQFSRRVVLPEEFDPDTVETFLNAEGKMTIKAAKPKPQLDETKERIIPIQHVASTSSEGASGEQEKVEAGTEDKAKDSETQEKSQE